ncbi:MAG: OmpA family protein, partial [Bacteroidota bacterium]
SDGSAKGSGISMSTRSGSGWSIPATIEIKDFYNDSKYNEFCLSSNKKILLMTVQRKDSYGDKDIYVSFDKNGVFTAPMNLGPVVNSFDNEASPFLASDEKTLYYSSKGKPGYGSSDIFVTRRLDDTWKNWSPPQNLGPEINSADWDAYYTIPASGDYAYLVSQDNSIGQGDIFRIKPPEAAKPEPVLLIYGKVLNKKNNEPMEAFITYNNLMTDEEIGTAVSDSKTGEYKIILPLGTNYSFRAAQEGFYPVSDNLDVSTLENYGEIERNLYLSPIEVGETIRLNNIFFDLDKATLKEESFSELNRLVRLLKENATMSITISGHTDNQGSDQYNLKLSEDRVNSVIQYLITNGVAKDRLSGKGYGESNPIGTNDTEEGKAINRRVEFTIDKK